MAPRFKGFTYSKLEKLVDYFEDNADSDLEDENDIHMSLNWRIDKRGNAVINNENTKRIFEWKVAGK